MGETGIAKLDWRARPPDLLTVAQWGALVSTLQLSEREAQLACAICCGETESTTARRLGISPSTVHTYRERLYRKLGVRSYGETVALMFAVHVQLQLGHEPQERP